MIPLKLTLKGAIGIKKGLNLNEITIDFTKFKPGLIALVGANGSGKTTILENCVPHAALLSREGSIYDHFFGTNALKELTFSLNGDIYVATIKINAVKRTRDSVLTKNGVRLVIGNEPYDATIDTLVGPLDVITTSIFTVQKAAGWSQLTKAERKELMQEYCGTKLYTAYQDYCSKKIQALSGVYQTLTGNKTGLQGTLINETEKQQRLVDVYQQLEIIESSLGQQQEKLLQLQAAITLKQSAAQTVTTERRLVQDLVKLLSTQQTSLRNEVTDKTYLACITQLRQKLALADEREYVTSCYNALTEWKAFLENALSQQQLQRELTTELQLVRQTKTRLEKARNFGTVPCTSNLQLTCPLYIAATNKVSATEIEQLTAKEEALALELATIDVSDDDVTTARSYLVRCVEEKIELKFARLATLADEIQLLTTQRSEILNEIEQHNLQIQATIAAIQEQLVNQQTRLQQAEQAIKGLDELQQQSAALTTECKTLQTSQTSLSAEAQLIKSQLEQNQTIKQQIDILTEQLIKHKSEIDIWISLKSILGEVALMRLANAGTEISALANDLLLNVMQAEFTLAFTTLEKAKSNKSGKEYVDVFDIKVYRGDDQVLIGMLSGGEQVIVQQALTQAFSIYYRKEHPAFGVQVIDENDGALDSENKIRYLQLCEAIHHTCGIHYTFIVSHDTTIKTMVHQKIVLTKATLELEGTLIQHL